MAAGAVSVQLINNATAASVKTAMDVVIAATSVAARVTVSQIDNGRVLITAIEV